MNYRHIYHAGNAADVLKHTTLIAVIEALKQKEKPFCVIDTHAGIGLYNLSSVQANKTREYQEGIGKLYGATPNHSVLKQYISLVTTVNEEASIAKPALNFYPGSPEIIRSLLRKGDQLTANELHPEDFQTLRARYHEHPNIILHNKDAYIILKALLPPNIRRGLVLVDPPFEVEDERKKLVDNLKDALKKWPQGTYLVWYPVKQFAENQKFIHAITDLQAGNILRTEVALNPGLHSTNMRATGMICINTPWKLEQVLKTMLKELKFLLDIGHHHTEWLKAPL